VHAKPNTIYLI